MNRVEKDGVSPKSCCNFQPKGGIDAWVAQPSPELGQLVVQPLKTSVAQQLDQLRSTILQLPATAFDKNTAQRKTALSNQLKDLINLVNTSEYRTTYDTLVHDLKPKLTGLKTDENELPWGNGLLKNPSQSTLRTQCNQILFELKSMIPA